MAPPWPLPHKWERKSSEWLLSMANEIEKELDGALPCGDDMVRAERLRGSACPAHVVVRDVEVRV